MFRKFLLLFSIILCLAGEVCAGGSKVAVMDFIFEGGAEETWAAGVADFLEVELQNLGVEIYERRQLRYLLGEKNLQDRGVTARSFIRFKALTHMVSGKLVKKPGGQFVLTASLIKNSGGISIYSPAAEGMYPKDLAAAVNKIAGQLASKMAKSGKVTRRKIRGFTAVPEVALQYYKGMDHLVSGRHAQAIASFEQAHMSDDSFRLATAWAMRSYDAAGLHGHAGVAREFLLSEQDLYGLESMALSSAARSKEMLVVGLAGTKTVDAGFLALFKSALSQNKKIAVFSPEFIRKIAAENDLKLTGHIEKGDEESNWLSCDAIVSFTASSASKKVVVRMYDSLTGRSLAVTVINKSESASKVAGRLLKSYGSKGRKKVNPLAVRNGGGKRPAVEFSQSDTYEDILDKVIRDTSNLKSRLRLAREYYFRNSFDPYYKKHCLVDLDHVIAAIDKNRKIEEAPYMLSIALSIRQNAFRFSHAVRSTRSRRRPPPGIPKKASVEDAYEKLLAWYPNSLPAVCIQFHIANKLAAAGKDKESLKILTQMPPEFAESHARLFASYNYLLARELLACGRSADARILIANAEEKVRRNTAYIDMPVYHLIGPDGKWMMNHGKSDVAGKVMPSADILAGFRALRKQRVRPGEVLVKPGPDLKPAPVKVAGLGDYEKHFNALRALSKSAPFKYRLTSGDICLLTWLNLKKKPGADTKEYDVLVANMAEKIAEQSCFELYMSSGKIDKALAVAREELKKAGKDKRKVSNAIMRIAEVGYYQYGTKKALDYLQQQIMKRYPNIDDRVVTCALEMDSVRGETLFTKRCLSTYLKEKGRYHASWALAVSGKLHHGTGLLKKNVDEGVDADASLHRLKMFRVIGTMPKSGKYLYPVKLTTFNKMIPADVAAIMRSLTLSENYWTTEFIKHTATNFKKIKPCVRDALNAYPGFGSRGNWTKQGLFAVLRKVEGGTEDFMPELSMALYRDPVNVAYWAPYPLMDLKQKAGSVAPALIIACQANNRKTIGGCETALMLMSPLDKDKYPDLKFMLSHKNESIRALARKVTTRGAWRKK